MAKKRPTAIGRAYVGTGGVAGVAGLQARARRAAPTKIALAQSFPHRIRARKRSLKKFGACDLRHTQSAAGGVFSHTTLEGRMPKLGVLRMVAVSMGGG